MKLPVLGTYTPSQVAIICHDIEATKTAYANFLGKEIPPTVSAGDYVVTKTEYYGEPNPDAASLLAFIELGNITLELIQPNEAKSTWRDFLEKNGEGLHHLAFNVEDIHKAMDDMKAQGFEIGKSLLEADRIDYAKDMIAKAAAKGVKFLLPTDNYCAAEFSKDAEPVLAEGNIPADLMGMDIGPNTRERFCAAVADAGTVVWNGPMGVFEFDNFAGGTRAMAKALTDCGAVTIIGGGDSAAAIEQMGFADKVTHISTGGGASLEFLEGKELPGVACLLDK